MVVPHSQKALPSRNGEGQHPLQLVMIGLVGQIHAPAHEGKTGDAVHGSPGPVLHKRPCNWVHLMKTRQPQPFLGGKSVCAQSRC